MTIFAAGKASANGRKEENVTGDVTYFVRGQVSSALSQLLQIPVTFLFFFRHFLFKKRPHSAFTSLYLSLTRNISHKSLQITGLILGAATDIHDEKEQRLPLTSESLQLASAFASSTHAHKLWIRGLNTEKKCTFNLHASPF